MIKSINKDLAKVYVMVEEVDKVVQNLDAARAKEEYIISEKALRKFRSYYTILEDTDFFNDAETKQLAENTLLKLYSVEGKLRLISFDESPTGDRDKELKDAATRISLNALPQLHATA